MAPLRLTTQRVIIFGVVEAELDVVFFSIDAMDYIRENDNTRWLGYFDLLGTTQLVKSGKTRDVFRSFAEASKSLGTLNRFNANIFHAWFSDTFIIYSKDDSRGCAACILGNWVKEGDSDSSALLTNLRKMRDEQKDERIIRKYTRTIEFIERHQTGLHES